MKWRTIRSNDQEIPKVLKYLTFIIAFIQMTDYNRHIINSVNYKCSIKDQIILFIINYIHNNIVDFIDSVLNTQLSKPFYPKNVSNISSRLRYSKNLRGRESVFDFLRQKYRKLSRNGQWERNIFAHESRRYLEDSGGSDS